MTEVLLVQPPLPEAISVYAKEIVLCPPLGLGYLASTLLEADFTVDIMDMAIVGIDEAAFKSELQRRQPRIVGITTNTLNYKNALKIAKIVKKLDPGIITIIGGPHVTFTADATLEHQEVDIIVRREGEITLPELVDRLLRRGGQLKNVDGISYRQNGKVVNNPERPLIQDLDRLPYPARHLFPMRLYKVPGSIITGRGCPSKCIFCSAGALSGGRYRIRSPENVISEIKDMVDQFGFDYFFVADDSFTISQERTRKICRGLQDLRFKAKWSCESRVDIVSREMLQEIAGSGCICIQFGVESGSQRTLKSIRKGITVEQVRKAVQWAVEARMLTYCNFMMPFPEDTTETLKETEKLMIELKKIGAHLVLSLTTPFPGTYLSIHAEELGISILSNDTDCYDFVTPLFTTRHLSLEQIEQTFNYLNTLCDKIPFCAITTPT